MSESNIKDTVIDRIIGLSEEDAQKVYIFLVGLDAGNKLQNTARQAINEELSKKSGFTGIHKK